MSLVGTLAKVALGVAVAKGMKSMTGGGAKSSGGGIGDLLGGMMGGGASQQQTGGGLGDLLGSLGAGSTSSQSGGISDILGSLSGGSSSSTGGAGGLGDLMGGLLGGGAGGAGMGDLLGKLGGAGSAGGLGGLLTGALGNGGQVTQTPSQQDEDAAGLMIRAMMQAAKADGNIDQAERDKLMSNVGELSQEEAAFINAEMERDVDIAGLVRDVPKGMEDQVYMMSVMGINLDTQNEASYLNDLAQNMGLGQTQVNNIHEMLGVQPLYG
tara:strand:- start:1039 stop:1842 length:804 start_codon:yes stop_codon:yes gene_type:complete